MQRRVGRYTKYETNELLRMFDQGYSVYKICKELNRTQKSIRNNLIRLGKIEGQITPVRHKNKRITNTTDESLSKSFWSYITYVFALISLTILFVVHPQYNFLEVILIYFFYD
ncbi:hypothetical protein OA529_02910 [Alphaproteobacteria bacterium]|nr:hypothetical protein [Alphaproteobacteria bacterium]